MKSPLILLLVLVSGLALLGLAAAKGAILILAVPLVIYVGVAVFYHPNKPVLTLTRQVSDERVAQGLPVTISLTLVNDGTLLEEVLVDDPIPDTLKILDGTARTLTTLSASEMITLEYTAQTTRGAVNIEAAQVTVRETFGLFQIEAFPAIPLHVSVYPRFSKMRALPIRPTQTRGFSGPIPSRQSGTGLDFFTVREYHPGDAQRYINWKVSARRTNELFTNTFEQERVADVGIILDSRYLSNQVTQNGPIFEHSVRATAALADTLLRAGNRVGLLVYGGTIQRVFPGYGKVQQERILQTLARATPGLNYALEDLGFLPTRFFPSKSQVILVSPLMTDDLRVLIRLRADGYSVIVISPDALDFEASGGKGNGIDPYAYRLAHAERAFLLHKIRRVGVQAVDWKVNEPLDQAVMVALTRQPARQRGGGLIR